MTTQTAAVDANFIFHMAEIDRPKEQIAEIFGQVLNSLGLCAVIHLLAYDKELISRDEKIDTLFSKRIIRQLSFDVDIFQGDDAKEAYYGYLIPELYRRLTGDKLPENKDMLTYWKGGGRA